MRITTLTALFFTVFSLGSATLYATPGEGNDTLTMVKNLRENGEIHKALDLLCIYNKNHPEDLNTLWLYAQTSFWQKDFKKSKVLYKKALELFPSEKALRLDYAKTLAEMGDIREAEILLLEYTLEYPDNAEAWYILARITYWKGYTNDALKMLNNIIRNAPGFLQAKTLRDQIFDERLPWIRLNSSFNTDDQPLRLMLAGFEGGKTISSLLNPDFRIDFPTAFPDDDWLSYQSVNMGNRMSVNEAKTRIYFNAGIIRHHDELGFDWTARLNISQKLGKFWTIAIEGSRLPYLSTISSLGIKLSSESATLSATFDMPGSWNGKLNAGLNRFSCDDNTIRSFSGWIFAPGIKWRNLNMNIGAGFNYSDSDTNLYVSDIGIMKYINDYSAYSNKPVKGVYDPYFTPEAQQVISLLLNIKYNLNKNLSFNAKLNYGILAGSDYPYLYPDTVNGGEFIFRRGFVNKEFNPFDVSFQTDWKLGKRMALTACYTYNKTIFYSSHYFCLGLTKKMGYAKKS